MNKALKKCSKDEMTRQKVKCLSNIFVYRCVFADDLDRIVELFPGLIVNPAKLRKEIHDKGPATLHRLIEDFRV